MDVSYESLPGLVKPRAPWLRRMQRPLRSKAPVFRVQEAAPKLPGGTLKLRDDPMPELPPLEWREVRERFDQEVVKYDETHYYQANRLPYAQKLLQLAKVMAATKEIEALQLTTKSLLDTSVIKVPPKVPNP